MAAPPGPRPVAAFRAFVRLERAEPAANRRRVHLLGRRHGPQGGAALVRRWGRAGRPLRAATARVGSPGATWRTTGRILWRRPRHGYPATARR